MFWLVVAAVFVAYLLLQGSTVLYFAITLVSLLLAITVHECAHAWAADQLGDPTARLMGRLTLNPIAHLEPLGTIMMVVTTLTGMGIGWGKPVPVTPYRLRYGPRRGNGLVALSGPGSNLLVALVLGLLLRLGGPLLLSAGVVRIVLQSIVMTNIIIAVFNMLPLPPLDGYSVLLGLLSLSQGSWASTMSQFLERLSRYGPTILLGLIIFSQVLGLNLLGRIIGPPIVALYRLLLGPTG